MVPQQWRPSHCQLWFFNVTVMSFFRKYFLLILACFTFGVLHANVTFVSSRLERLSRTLTSVPWDSLTHGVYNDYSFNEHPLTIRVNKWDEIEHIGYRFFDNDQRCIQPSPVYDFLERYLLEYDIPNEDGAPKEMRFMIDEFDVEYGNLNTLFHLDTSFAFQLSYLAYKRYHLSWYQNYQEVLSVSFPMDYQLMCGSNSLELESFFIRDIQRYSFTGPAQQVMLPDYIDTCNDDYYIVEGSSYLSNLIRDDQFYGRNADGAWSLVCSRKKALWSASNIMLYSQFIGNYDLQIAVDRYGYKTDTVHVPLTTFVSYCKAQGSSVYFGVKFRTEKYVKGTLFVTNPENGFTHILSVDIPIDVIESRSGTINSVLYVYIPLHNISDNYFNLQYVPRKHSKTVRNYE